MYCLVLFLVNCEGDNGAIGPAGENGINGVDGIDGTNGTDGTNGENGIGFDELTKYGSITLTLNGKRPDGIPFTDTATFKFAPAQAPYNIFYVPSLGPASIFFDTYRFLGPPGDTYHAGIRIKLKVNDPGAASQVFEEFALFIANYPVISDDLKYFEITNGFESDNVAVFSNLNITNYSFNEETNHLIFSFSFDVAAAGNSTGNDLTVSGEVDIILFEDLFPPD